MARGAEPITPKLIEVHLIGLSLPLRAHFIRHNEGLLRELALIRIGEQQDPAGSLPRRLLQIAAELNGAYAPFQARPEAAMDAAAAAGQDYCDVTYVLPAAAAPVEAGIRDVLEEADDFCRAQQHLLTLPAPQEVVAYRRWLLGEMLRQLQGQPPRPWHTRTTHPQPPPSPSLPQDRATGSGGSGANTGAGEAVHAPLALDPEANAVAAARRYVRRALLDLHAQEVEDAAELGVSELVTNALLHARTACTITVRSTPAGRVRIEVRDSSPLPVQQRRFGVGATTGRGLRLVEAVSLAWGVDPVEGDETGKTVWFEPRPSAEQTGEDDPLTLEASSPAGFTAADWADEIDSLR